VIKYAWYRSGALFGIRYEIPEGERLPTHSHDDSRAHDVIVLSGQVGLRVIDALTRASAGSILQFDGSKRHTVIAITDAVILNLFHYGMPAGYESLPESEHSGSFESHTTYDDRAVT
jgi:quercetin dioxygenase-like cupin family protein